MKTAEDFRRIARVSLNGSWLLAVMVGIVASILGAIGTNGSGFKINFDVTNQDLSFNFAGHDFFTTEGINSGIWTLIAGVFGIILVIAIFIGIIYFVLGSFVGLGYAKFNLNLIDIQNPTFANLFEYFAHWKTAAVTRLLRTLYVFLWTLLFIIPGIVANYNYAMTEYILAENPYLTPTQAIERSKEMMYGNRFRLFCLEISFIGWDILAALTFGLGYLWLTPYKQAAYAVFYREVSGTEFYTEESNFEVN